MPRRSERCAACEREFEVGESIRAVLCESPEGYQRRDYCCSCEPAVEPPPLATWLTRRPEPPTPKHPTFNVETVLHLFEQLEQPQSAEQAQLRFVLALLLWRRKVLRLEGTEATEAGEVWRFAARGAKRTYEVLRTEVDEQRAETLGEQIAQLVASGCIDEPTLPERAGESAESSDA